MSLEDSGQYQVRLVLTAREARASCSRGAYDLAILDAALADEPFVPLCNALMDCHPGLRLIVIPPENDPNHPSLDGLKAHGFLTRPFYLPDLLEMTERLLSERGSKLPGQADSPPTETQSDGSPAWLQEPQAMTSYLEKELAGTQALAGIIARFVPGATPAVRAFSSSLGKESAQALTETIQRYWSRGEQTDLMRYIRLDADKKDSLAYATRLTGDLLLILVYHRDAPLSQIRPQTREVALTLVKDPPDNYHVEPAPDKALPARPPVEPQSPLPPQASDEFYDIPPLDEALAPEDEVNVPMFDLSELLGTFPPPDPLRNGSGVPASANIPTTPRWQIPAEEEPDSQSALPPHENGKRWKDALASAGLPAVEPAPAEQDAPAAPPAGETPAAGLQSPASEEPPPAAGLPSTPEVPPDEEPTASLEDLASAIHWEQESPDFPRGDAIPLPEPELPLDEIWALEPPAPPVPETGALPVPVAEAPAPEVAAPLVAAPEMAAPEAAAQEEAAPEGATSNVVALNAEEPAAAEPAAAPDIHADGLLSEKTRPLAGARRAEGDALAPRAETGEEVAEIDLLEDTRPRIVPAITQLNQLEPVSPALALLNYTCVLVPRLPQHYLIGELADRLPQWVGHLCLAFGWRLDGIAVRPEYLQWSVQVAPAVSPGNIVRILRQRLSQNIFVTYPHLVEQNPSGDFWATGYLIVSGPQPPSAQLLRDYILQTRRRQGLGK